MRISDWGAGVCSSDLGDEEGSSEWQDWLVDETPNQETRLAEGDEFDSRHKLLEAAMGGLNERERALLVQRRLTENPATLDDLSPRYGLPPQPLRHIEGPPSAKLQESGRPRPAAHGLPPTPPPD